MYMTETTIYPFIDWSSFAFDQVVLYRIEIILPNVLISSYKKYHHYVITLKIIFILGEKQILELSTN